MPQSANPGIDPLLTGAWMPGEEEQAAQLHRSSLIRDESDAPSPPPPANTTPGQEALPASTDAPVTSAEEGVTALSALSNDPSFSGGSLWGLYGDASTPANAFGSQAAEVWDKGVTGSTKVVVGIVDTGINYTHVDLYLNIWLNQGEIPRAFKSALSDVDGDGLITFRDLNDKTNAAWVSDINKNGYIDAGDLLNDSRWENGIDEDGNGLKDDLIGWDYFNNDNDPWDDNGHGTHVAGTVGAVGGNGVGVVGVNWSVQLVALKFSGADGSGFTSKAASALDYFTNASKLNPSQNFVATNNSWSTSTYSSTLQGAIDRAAKADILTVAS
jgi:subtilisin family serine protease